VTTIRLALDWSPNTLHAGFFYAFHQGWYDDENIDLVFTNPEEDGYRTTPAKQLANEMVHFAIAPSESILSYRTLPTPVPLVAVAAMLQEDTSAIVSLKKNGITKPAMLDGKSYASYSARFEDCIVKKLIVNDGGCGMLRVEHPEKLGIWDTLLNDGADSTWVFMPWEGVEAKLKNIELNAFKLADYGIPYGYSPLLISHENVLLECPETTSQFLKITQKGFEFVANNPEESASFLCENMSHANFKNSELIKESLKMLKPSWLKNNQWGMMDERVWKDFIDWLIANKVLCDIDGEYLTCISSGLDKLYTNQYLK
jgi:ABC-type nitrate/sulfonate/bicarbonate transport system substrate-binding protein